MGLEYRPQDLIGLKLAPMLNVSEKSAKYLVFGKDHMRIPDNTRRSSGAEANVVEFGLSSDDYMCEKHALKTPILDDVKDSANIVTPEKLNELAVTTVMHGLLLTHEAQVKKLFTTPGSYNASNTSTPGTLWDAASATPKEDIDDAVDVIRTATGCSRQDIGIIFCQPVWKKMKWSAYFTDVLRSTERKIMTTELMASVLDVGHVLIADSFYNAAKKGKAATMTQLWSNKDAIVAYLPNLRTGDGMTASFGEPACANTFRWTRLENSIDGLLVKEPFYDWKTETTWIEAAIAYGIKPTWVDSSGKLTGAYLLDAVVS
jgi:hypothetical protein